TNRGAVIKSWQLQHFTNKSSEGPVPVELMYEGGRFKGPLSIKAADEALTKQLVEGLYEVERDFSRLDADHPVGSLTFTYRDPKNGIVVQKELRFHHQKYLVDVRIKTQGMPGQVDVGLGTNFGIVEWGEGFIGLVGPAYLVDDDLEKDNPDQELERKGDVQWVALQDKYFMSVLIPQAAEAVVITNEGDKLVSAGARFPGSQSVALQLYAGPKQYDTLQAMNVRLEDTIDFGWFIYGSWDIVRALAKPLFFLLRFFYGFTHNYGLAIILLTLCIKLLFVPLQYKSYKSMKDMQVIQPKVAELQKKLKDDRQRLNQELIKLYRDHKVNPVGGCLPMLLQMPVFIALFNILYMTIDLRQAPFMLWIDDMSVPDPFFVLPILMGVSMVLQQKIMPTTMDPTQAKMMLLLPVFLTFIFLNFASGLVLYWLTNNVLTIAQQFITDRYIFKRPTFSSLMPPSTEPAENSMADDGQKPGGGKRKKKDSRKAEDDSAVESQVPEGKP
ncbi:MAG: membrane protein insertase YidC, partial [Nitrospiraceae bacterium]